MPKDKVSKAADRRNRRPERVINKLVEGSIEEVPVRTNIFYAVNCTVLLQKLSWNSRCARCPDSLNEQIDKILCFINSAPFDNSPMRDHF